MLSTIPAPLGRSMFAAGSGARNSLAGTARRIFSRLVLAALGARVKYRTLTIGLLRSGPAIVQCNHVSYIDGLLIALASPVPLVFGVDAEFSRRNRWTRMGMRLLARMGYGQVIPLDQKNPAGLRHFLRRLEAGERIVLFPEGAISSNGIARPALPGARWLADRSGCPLLRVQIEGAHRSRLFGKAGRQWRPPILLLF